MIGMTVYELCDLYIESGETMNIYSCDEEQNVFEGTFREAMYSEYSDKEVSSFGIEAGRICINI